MQEHYLRGTLAGDSPHGRSVRLPDHARAGPPQHPDRLQLYSLNTPNGVKVSIMLEEIGLPYEPHLVDISKNETRTPEFLSLNPNGKIPAILDPDGPGGKPLGLFESGAILLYLADKTGKLMPADPARRYETIAVGVLPDGRRSGRCSARSASSTSSPAGRSRTSGRSSATSPNRSGCSACSRRGSTGATWIMGDDYTIADIATARLGAQPDRLLRGARAGRFRQPRQRRRLAGARPGAAGGAEGAADTVARLILACSVRGDRPGGPQPPASGCDRRLR